jgi:hypothetical protein
MNRRAWAIFVFVCLLLAGTSGVLAYLRSNQRLGRPAVRVGLQPTYDGEGSVVATNSVDLPERVLDMDSSTAPMTRKELEMLPKDTTFGRRVYRAPDGFQIACNVILMGSDRTSIHKPEYCLPGQGWLIDERAKEQVGIPIDRPHPYQLPVMKWFASGALETADGRKTALRAVYVFWFVADNEMTASHYDRLRWLSRDLLLKGVLQRWAYVSCFAVCYPGQEEATFQRIRAFIAEAVPEFQSAPASKSADPSSHALHKPM